MKKLIFDAAYFGAHNDLSRKSGYSNYLKLVKEQIFLNRADSVIEKVSGSILELGCGIGVYVKKAREKGLNWKGLDSSNWCYDNLITDIIAFDAMDFLKDQPDNSFDWIVSFSFLECFTSEQLIKLKKEMDRVAINQIHKCHLDGNPTWYNNKVSEVFSEVENVVG